MSLPFWKNRRPSRLSPPQRRRTRLQSEWLEPRTMLAETSGWFNGGAYLSTDRSSVPVPSVNSGYTIEAWVRRLDANRCEAVVASGYRNFVSSGGFFFGTCTGQVFFNSNVLASSGHTGATTIPANVWTHIAVTWSAFEERFYVNGELDRVVAPGPEPNRDQTRLYVGATRNESPVFAGGGPLNFFYGNIAEARVWDSVRSQDQIRRSMHALLETRPDDLVAAWHLSPDANDAVRNLPTTNTAVCICGPAAPPLFRVVEVDANFNKLPAGRSASAAAAVFATNTAYLIGGRTSLSSFTSEITAIDMGTGNSQTVANLPVADAFQAAAHVPDTNSIYVFGGRTVGAQIVKYDLTTGVVTTLAATLPTNLSDSVAVWHPKIKRIVLIGNYFNGGSGAIQLFDPATETISTAGVSLPAVRYDAVAAYSPVTDRIYVFGGYMDAVFTAARGVFEIQLQADGTGVVTTLPPSADLPLPTQFGAAFEDPKTHLIHVLGGTAEYVQTFDPRSGKAWRTMTRMPRNYSGNPDGAVLNASTQAVVYSTRNRHALVIGGFSSISVPVTNKMWRVPIGDGPAVPIEHWDFVNDLTGLVDGDDKGVYVSGNGATIPVTGIDENGNRYGYGFFGGTVEDIAYSPSDGLWVASTGFGAWQFYNGTTTQFSTPTLGTSAVYSVQPEYPWFGTDRGLIYREPFTGYQTAFHPNIYDRVWAQTGHAGETWGIVRGGSNVDSGSGPWRLGHAQRVFDGGGFYYTETDEWQSVCGDRPPWGTFGLRSYEDLALDKGGNLWVVGLGQGAESICLLPASTLNTVPAGGLASSSLGSSARTVDLDADNRVWVGLQADGAGSGGLSVFELNTATSQLRNSEYNWLNAPIGSRSPLATGGGTVWDSSIYALAGVDEKVWATKFAGGIPGGMVTVSQRWQQLDEVMAGQTVYGIWTVAGSTFFNLGYGLYELKPDGLTYEFRLTLGNPTNVVAGDGAGRIWMGTNQGPRLYLPSGFDDLSDRAGTRPAGRISAIVEAFDADPYDGQAAPVWLGGDDGLTLFDRNRFVTTFTAANSGLPATAVKSLLVDRAGNVWAGTDAGLARLSADMATWTTFTTAQGLPSNSIFDLAETGDRRIAVSTANGLTLFNGSTFAPQSPPVAAVNLPLSVDNQGRLWAGSALLTAAGWRGYWSTNSGLKYSTISDSATDGADRIWFSHAPNPGVSLRGTFLPPLKSITPIITGYSPAAGHSGTIVTLTGLSLGSDPSEITVSVGGSPVDIVSVSETQVQVKLRDDTTSGAVSLTRGGKRTTATAPFCAVPQYRAHTPTGANVGVQVDVYGTNFDYDATISIGGGPTRGVDGYSPTSLKRILESADETGQIVVSNHCAGATTASSLNFRKIDLSIPHIAFNQGLPGSRLVEDKATLFQNYISAGGATLLGEKIEIDEVREYITDRDGFVRRIDTELNVAGVTPPLVDGMPSDAQRLMIATSQNVPNLSFMESGQNTVRTVLLRRGRPIAEATTTVDVAANLVLEVLLIPFMRPDATPQDLQAMRLNIESDLAHVRERIFPFGTVNVVWANESLYRSEPFSLDNFLNLYRAAPDMDRVRNRYNRNPNRPDAQIAMGVVHPSLAAGAPGFAFGADVSQLLNTLILDDLDTLCDAVNGVVETLSFGLLGSDDGCHLDIPLYMGWMKGDAASGDTLAHEIGHQLGLVKPWATNGSLDDNLSHSTNDELPEDMVCTNWDNVSFDWSKSFSVQPGVKQPIVDPIAGTQFSTVNDNNPNSDNRAKAMMSYACGSTSANSFFEPVDVGQMSSQLIPLASSMIGVAKRLALFGGSPAADSPASAPAAAGIPLATPHPPNAPASAPNTSGPRLHVFGTLDALAETGELIRVESSGDEGPLTPSFATGYWLVQLDAAGNELARTGVAPVGSVEQNIGGPAGEPTQFIFSATLRRQPSTARLELRHIDIMLDSFAPGDAIPVVQIGQPIGGENVAAGSISVEWTATDADEDPLQVSIEYSRDDGVSWSPIGSATGSGALDVAVESLAGASGLGRFRITASDGLKHVDVVSEAFSVADQAPQVAIDMGMNGAFVLEGKSATFSGNANDAEDGLLGGASLSWSSSRDGHLGSGATLSTAMLSVGFHVITLVATDSVGNSTLSSIYLNVGGDYDFDGIDDADEAATMLNPLNSWDAFSDVDADGLSLLVERQIGSDPLSTDTDGDGRSDDVELVDGTSASTTDDPPAADALSTSVTNLSFVVDFAADTPLPQATLGVMSRLPADWTLVSDVDWLEATATTGTTPATTLLRVQAYRLADGDHVAQLRFVSTTAGMSAIVPLTVRVVQRSAYFDVDGNGTASEADCVAVQAAVGLTFGDTGYDLHLDVDRDGTIESTDVAYCDRAIGVTSLSGDFDLDLDVDAGDIDLLFAAIAGGANDPFFDLTGDGLVTRDDTDRLVQDILHTAYGDANLDGRVDRTDMSSLAQYFGYIGAASWIRGDFNGDGQVDLGDAAVAQANSNFASAQSPSAQASPAVPASVLVGARVVKHGAETPNANRSARMARRIVAAVDDVIAAHRQMPARFPNGLSAARTRRASRPIITDAVFADDSLIRLRVRGV